MVVDLLKTSYGVEVLKDVEVCTISLLQSTVLWIGGVAPVVLPSPFVEFQSTCSYFTKPADLSVIVHMSRTQYFLFDTHSVV